MSDMMKCGFKWWDGKEIKYKDALGKVHVYKRMN
jgi:hypothetical protein